jgi:hypothetical protein
LFPQLRKYHWMKILESVYPDEVRLDLALYLNSTSSGKSITISTVIVAISVVSHKQTTSLRAVLQRELPRRQAPFAGKELIVVKAADDKGGLWDFDGFGPSPHSVVGGGEASTIHLLSGRSCSVVLLRMPWPISVREQMAQGVGFNF